MDIAEIGIAVDTSDVKLAKTDLQAIDAAFNSAERSASIFVQAFSRATARAVKDAEIIRKSSQAFQVLVNSANNVTNSYKSAEASAEAFTTELRKQEAQAIRTAQANQSGINKQLNVNQPSAISSGASFGAMEAEIERLSLKYNKIYAASTLYESSLNELNRAHQLGAISAKQHALATDALNNEFSQFNAGTANLSNRFVQYDANMQRSNKSTARFGVVAQQVGYQVGDFFVQVQSGQSALVAFAQQGTQLAGLLPGIAGAVIGIGLSLSTAILGLWMRAGDASNKAGESAKSYGDILKGLEQANKNFYDQYFADSQSIDISLSKPLQERIRLSREAGMAEYDLNNLILSGADLYGRARIALELKIAAQKEVSTGLREELAALDELISKNKEGASAEDARAKAKENADRNTENFINRIAASLDKVDDAAARSANFITLFASKAIDGASAADKLEREIGTAAMNALRLAGVDISAGVSSAAASAAVLAANLGISLNAALAMANMLSRVQAGPDERGSQRQTVIGATNHFTADQPWLNTGGGGSGGGGGGPSVEDQLEKELDVIRQSSAAKAELEVEEYEKRQETLKSALDRKMITLAEYNSLELQIAKDHAAALTEIDVYRYGTALDQAGQFFGDMAAAMQGGNEKMARIGKIFGAAEALINAFRAFNQVLADPSLPWFAKIPAGVAVLSAGMGMVNAIKSGSGSASTGGGGSRGSASVSSATAPQAPQRILVQGINPDDIFTGQWLSNFFDNFYKENNDRGAVFMVNR